ncbi:hypothetical protein [Mucilaginibacter flavidus]|uniref:hypothetical protein n=1 Tax=Mucilaginibacter flavidus TaxID=2949309 RepID=UPI002093DF3F|nr:hypothetical protein [Mucilaginibacter flavidus]MCO5949081.1 hypothetical protein [Mucilaginibacter flavidus]
MMKKSIFSLLTALILLAVSSAETKAQVSASVSIGIWTPPPEYASVNYYYLPDVEAYYYVPTHQYVYLDGPSWVFRPSLPPRYASYNISTGYKVAVNRPRAYRYFGHDRRSYEHFRGRPGGTIVRDHYHTRVINRPGRSEHFRGGNVHNNIHGGIPHGGGGRPHGVGGAPHGGGGHGGGGAPHGGGGHGGGGAPHGGGGHGGGGGGHGHH